MTFDELTKAELDIIKQKDFRFLILETPYDTIESPQTQKLLGSLSALKIEGYRLAYPYGALPVDSTDFCANHLVLCERVGTEYVPAFGMKSITYDRTKTFQLEFPALHIVESQETDPHRRAILDLMQSCENTGERLAYNGSYTISPKYREDRAIRNIFRDFVTFLLIRYYDDYGIDHVIAGATLRFKIDQLKNFVGFKPLKLHNEELPSFLCEPFFGEPVLMMHRTQASPEAREWANQFNFLWENRIVIKKEEIKREINIAA